MSPASRYSTRTCSPEGGQGNWGGEKRPPHSGSPRPPQRLWPGAGMGGAVPPPCPPPGVLTAGLGLHPHASLLPRQPCVPLGSGLTRARLPVRGGGPGRGERQGEEDGGRGGREQLASGPPPMTLSSETPPLAPPTQLEGAAPSGWPPPGVPGSAVLLTQVSRGGSAPASSWGVT